MASIYDLKIFRLNRIKYEELWQDALNWVRRTYNATEEQFTMASPFAQLLSVILHLGRMVFYYIEDSVTGLNIKTAYRPDQIRGLAQLTGHSSTRPISARASVRLSYINNGNLEYNGQVCYMLNKQITVKSKINGCSYVLLFNADSAKITMNAGNYIDANLIQGVMKYQKATGTGEALQSFNFSERNYSEIEEYFINVYVNNEPWEIVPSLLDMGYQQKACTIKTGQIGGVDVFFGNGDMGMIPPQGSVIMIEYVVSDGVGGNLAKDYVNSNDDAWQIEGYGSLPNGEQVPINENFRLTLNTSLIFGAVAEDITLTQMIAPHMSRSFVLANETNYKYFFKRMNMFSTIEVIKGYSSKEANVAATIMYNKAQAEYSKLFDEWQEAVSMYGETADETKAVYEKLENSLDSMHIAQQKMDDTDMNDNTVYILLIPDITKRISSSVNYFTCDEKLFTLTNEEQYNILQLIENSGQKIITMENRILTPKVARFAINANVKIWNGYNIESVYADCIDVLSKYLLTTTRKDMIPLSDITALFEGVEGIDSVKVAFDADVQNENVYGQDGFYGIDEFGDVVLTRKYTSQNGTTREVRDILPLFRGGFTSPQGIEYSEQQSNEHNSAFNLNLVSYSTNTRLSLDTPIN